NVGKASVSLIFLLLLVPLPLADSVTHYTAEVSSSPLPGLLVREAHPGQAASSPSLSSPNWKRFLKHCSKGIVQPPARLRE
ncbi:MAG: hypothetical protein ACXADX_04490, partial [Candidatus Hodarchaeales archaeon]